MKLRSAWRGKQILTFSGSEVTYYYTNKEYESYKRQGYDISRFQRVFILSKSDINKYDDPKNYSAFFPPF